MESMVMTETVLRVGVTMIAKFLRHLEGQGDLVSRLITPITHIVTTIIPIINLLTKSPDPPSREVSGKCVCGAEALLEMGLRDALDH